MRKCRFGFPKPYAPETEMDADHRCTYRRDVGDGMVNNYNPYLLATFRTSMDIQYNDGPQAVRYLAKYLAKDDYEAKVLLKNVQQKNSGYYKKTSFVSEKDHYTTRIVGSVEAAYDVMGWHKHRTSRGVIFLNTNLVTQDTRRIKNDIKDLDENTTEIYMRTHVGKFSLIVL